MAIFPGEPGLAGFIGAKDNGGGGDNWSYKSCKAPVIINANKPTPNICVFERLDALSVCLACSVIMIYIFYIIAIDYYITNPPASEQIRKFPPKIYVDCN